MTRSFEQIRNGFMADIADLIDCVEVTDSSLAAMEDALVRSLAVVVKHANGVPEGVDIGDALAKVGLAAMYEKLNEIRESN